MGDSTNWEAEVSRIIEQAKELQDTAASLISSTTREEDSLRQRAESLDSNINRLRSTIRSSKLDSKRAEKLDAELFKASYILSEGDAAAFLPSISQGRFLRMFLGPINIQANRKDVQLKVKEEYNSFRGMGLSMNDYQSILKANDKRNISWMF